MKKHINLTIRGKVHGVGFRFSCMEAAYKFQIKGFVKNKSDGTVYIEAEGNEDMLNEFRKWCSKGPVWARVVDIEESSGELKDYTTFEIVH